MWPTHITIIANDFKRARFQELHLRALQWPQDRASLIGIGPDFMRTDEGRARFVRERERLHGFEAWVIDPRGVPEFLESKRRKRNPWKIEQGLFIGDQDGHNQLGSK
jgi:uncharacterized protein YciI